MTKILECCPACGGDLVVRELRCQRCDTEIRSNFELCPFCRLTSEQIHFLELFVQAKGNMRTLEQALGISYPTVRSRVEAIGARLRQERVAPSTTKGNGNEPTAARRQARQSRATTSERRRSLKK